MSMPPGDHFDDDDRGAVAPGGIDPPSKAPESGYDEVLHRPGAQGDDAIADEMRQIFAAALADEPESSVTPLSVLHEIRAQRTERSRRRWSREWTAWKWGGGLAVAAAAVGAVIVLGPALFFSGSATSASGSADSTVAASAQGGASAESAPSPEAAADSGLQAAALPPPGAAGGDAAQSGAADAKRAAGVDGGAQPSAQAPPEAAAGQAFGSASAAQSSQASAAPLAAAPDGSVACAAPPLTDAEWAAAVRALPQNVVIPERFAAGCGTEAQRAGAVHVGSSRSGIEILIGKATSYPAGLQPSLGDLQVGATVTATRGDTIVVVAASANSDTLVDRDHLTAVANAVLAAAQ